MTRPRKHTRHPKPDAGVKLSPSQRAELVELMWRDESGKSVGAAREKEMLIVVRSEMVFARSAAYHASGPTPTGQRAALLDVLRKGRALKRAIQALPEAAWEELNEEYELLDPDEPLPGEWALAVEESHRHLVLELQELDRAADTACQRLATINSHGRRPESLRNVAISRLIDRFREFSDVPPEDYRGCAQDFTLAALKMVGITAPDSEEKFWALVPKELHQPPASAPAQVGRGRQPASVARLAARVFALLTDKTAATPNRRRLPETHTKATRVGRGRNRDAKANS